MQAVAALLRCQGKQFPDRALQFFADDVESAGPNGFGMVVLLDGEVHCADTSPLLQLDASHTTLVAESVEPTAELRHQNSPLLSCW